MKKTKIRWALYLLFFSSLFFLGKFWVHEKVYSVSGYLVVPIVDIIPGDEWPVSIEDDQKNLFGFSLPYGELSPVIESQKDYPREFGLSEVKVTYQKNFWNQTVHPRIHVVRPGWIRRPK